MTRNGWVFVFALGAFSAACAAACTSGTRTAEHLGVQSSELFADGIPCASGAQCGSTFCVDGVCCATACGGGVRDTLACSNVYGPVAGLVNGTCKTLAVGDACGSLTTVNPCTWRGTTVNGGNNCPNPPGGASACFPCTTAAQCGGAFPVCVNGACVQCDGDNGGGTPGACPIVAPVCTSGLCVQCSATNQKACTAATPACNVATNTCVGCNGDNGSGATRACSTAAAPACLVNLSCAQCSATNAIACTGTTPSCNKVTNTCAACNGDNGDAVTQPCPTAANPFCFAAGAPSPGACGKCTNAADCVGHPDGTQCNTSTGACGATCVNDVDCADATKWCAAGVCTAKTANGKPLPATAPIAGTCTVANGTRACQSGVCSTTDNLCGFPNGVICGPPPVSADCRSGTCFATDDKCGLPAGQPCVAQTDCRSTVCASTNKCGDCQNDTTCGAATSGRVCDDIGKVCEPGCRTIAGNGCPSGKVCTSPDGTIGKCVDCIDDTSCGGPTSGQICNESKLCQPGCRGSGGNGCPTGATCSSADGSIGTCSGVADAGPACTKDSECGSPGSGRVCNDVSKTCVDGCRGQGGNGCPSGARCSSTSSSVGACSPVGGPVGGADGGGAPPADEDGLLEGGGFGCSITSSSSSHGAAPRGGLALFLATAALVLGRLRRRSERRILEDPDADTDR